MTLTKGTCSLCLQEKPLLAKSHIIPEFMYEFLFDKKHKMNKFAPSEYVRGKKKVQRPSSGEYEANILCVECDNGIIGQYETYGRRVLFAKSNESPQDPICDNGITETQVPITRCTNVDYKRFKLFLLSILWRASISKREFFKDVQLGPYEEEIRLMVYNGDPKGADAFPILLYSWFQTEFVDFVSEPSLTRKDRGVCYLFPIGGISYIFHISPESFDRRLLPFTILPAGVVSVFQIPRERGEEFFRNIHNVPK